MRLTVLNVSYPFAVRLALAAVCRNDTCSGGETRLEDMMAKHSTLDPDDLPGQDAPKIPKGHDVRSLGPSDSSDTGADMVGPGLIDDDALALNRGTNEDSEGGHLRAPIGSASVVDETLGATSDRDDTGERATAGKEPDIRIGNDIAPDRIVGPKEAGLGSGLDEAEEAREGISDDVP
jgi:hypothetical protein